ncbi:VWA domain-containing protein [Natronoflexus pectinivorans]|uniref:Ca-activated chloride channel family protein n=1 Tax=Natronoflexus pectinivorans TaxID=682526 RepID=A0A4R2GLB3_9BACT|nr:VWA domain-containing protein [Natronoflexus pectinivorans]TCO09367.1 Ca-activated chloride channel family protein [Natronoflexus pectinivorans]
MFRFGNPEYLYLLLLIPALAFIQLIFSYRKRKALERFGNTELLSHLMPDVSMYRPVVKFYLLLLALMGLIFTLAAPQFGTRLQTVQRQGIEIMIALDVSNSMNSQDIQPSRLERAKQAVARLTDRLVNDRIGIVVFAGNAYVQLPITSDYASARMFLNNITTDIVPTQGTAIGRAIELSMQSFTQQEDVNRAIIVISDGENHEDDAIGAAQRAAQNGILVYTVGMGSPEGGPIPVGGSGNFLRDRNGNVVITRLDEQMLADIAHAGNGEYIPANNIRAGINQLMNELSDLERADFETKVYTDFEDQFQYIAFLVLLILIIDFIILERKNKLLRNIDLFTVNKIEKEKGSLTVK